MSLVDSDVILLLVNATEANTENIFYTATAHTDLNNELE